MHQRSEYSSPYYPPYPPSPPDPIDHYPPSPPPPPRRLLRRLTPPHHQITPPNLIITSNSLTTFVIPPYGHPNLTFSTPHLRRRLLCNPSSKRCRITHLTKLTNLPYGNQYDNFYDNLQYGSAYYEGNLGGSGSFGSGYDRSYKDDGVYAYEGCHHIFKVKGTKSLTKIELRTLLYRKVAAQPW